MTALDCIAIVSPGAMGSGLGRVWREQGFRVVASVAGRSARTRELAAGAGLELLADLDAVVAVADLVISVGPPQQAVPIAADIAAACDRAGARPLIADVNAIAPQTVAAVAAVLEPMGLQLVDGSLSGPPPRPGGGTLLYLSGPRAVDLTGLGGDGLQIRAVGAQLGTASAVKMCTASVFKGFSGLLLQAMLTARVHGVEDVVIEDLRRDFPDHIDALPVQLAMAASKAWRYVGEMREIAQTQGAAGARPELFEALAEVYATISGTELAQASPEQAADAGPLAEVLDQLARAAPRRTWPEGR